jgi:branched-chain amino acid transport system substrate-binding protein
MYRKVSIVLILLLSLILVGCAGQEATETPPEAPEFIDIGAVVPLTGAFGGPGVQVKNGYEFAIEDINADGGIYVAEYDTTIPLRMTLLDDESDPTKTVSNLETLYAEDNVIAYLGGFGSSLHSAAAAIAEKNQVPYLGVAFAQWDIHQQGYKYLFSPFWKSPEIATEVFKMLNALIPEGQRPTRVAIFQETTDWGIELGGLWEEAAPDYGYEVVVHEEYAPLTEDFTDMILRAQDAEADMLLSLPIPPDGLTLYRQMGELDWAPKFSFAVRAPDAPTWAENLGTVGDYVTLGPGWHNAMSFTGVDALNQKHIDLVGRPADPMVGPSYACLQILADAIERAGSLDRAAIRDAIAATDTNTVIGPVTFRADGTGAVSSPILQYISGRQELVWPPDFATADFVYPAPAYNER